MNNMILNENKIYMICNKMKGESNKSLYLDCKRRASRVNRVYNLGEPVETHNCNYKEPPEIMENYFELTKLFIEYWYCYGESEFDIDHLRFYKRGVHLAGNLNKFKYFLDRKNDNIRSYDLFYEWVGKKIIYNYLEIEPFQESIMINISPKWNTCEPSDDKISLLMEVIEAFATIYNGSYFTRYKYVIENGKNNTNVHAHIVFEINKNITKTFRTFVKKSNHNKKLREIWTKLDVGSIGSLPPRKDNRGSLNHVWIRCRELLIDKLDYLIEDKKPEEHKNAYNPAFPILVNKWVDI